MMRLGQAAAAILLSCGSAIAQTLDLVGYWPGNGNVGSRLYGLSADGRIAAGVSAGGVAPPIVTPGFSWTRSGGRYDFGLSIGASGGAPAFGISRDGRFVVGEEGGNAYRWQSGSASLENLGRLPGHDFARGLDADETGETVVGVSQGFSGTAGQAFRWTSATGMVGLGFTRPGHFYSEAAATSRDGRTIVGHSRGSSGWNEAFIWREGTGMVALPGLEPVNNEGRAYGVNFDGRIVVGDTQFGSGDQSAVMWVDGVPTSLGFAPGWLQSRAIAVNDAGTVVVGEVRAGPVTQSAAIWTPELGMLRLSDYLLMHGITVPQGVNLLTATSISADGRTIGGYTGLPGQVREGFVVTIPAPASILALSLTLLGCATRRVRVWN